MELNLQKHTITVSEVVYDGDVEQPVECDALLPDYCPDIVKILKCALATSIGSTSLSGDRLTIEGVTVAHVYYASTGGVIRHTEYKLPFAKTVDMREAPAYPVVTVVPRVDYVNCRAVNQRRLDIRGAISLGVKICANREESVISDAYGGGLQLRRDMVDATEIVRQYDSPFSVQEDLDCGYGKPPIGNIVRTECKVNVIDYKLVSGKVVLKGEMLLHISYQPIGSAPSDNSNLEIMKYNLPISQILDCDGIGEECACDIQIFVNSCDVMPKADEAGEYRGFTLDVRLKASVTAHMNKEIPVASDCYSTQYECRSQTRPVTFRKLVDIVRENILHKTEMDLPDDVEALMDAWCEVDSLGWSCEDGLLNMNIRVLVSIFAKMTDGECQYFEQPAELTHKMNIPCDGKDLQFDPSGDILSCDYSLTGKEKIDIRCEIAVSGCLYRTVHHNSIGEIIVDESAVKQKQKNKLYLYYADEGESVWDIAKHYNTSASGIWEENALENDILPQKRMLLIPMA